MGYVPPPYPKPLPDFGQQWIGGPPKGYRPDTPYQRYVFDVYGPQGTDWMPVLGAGLIGSFIALVVAIVLLLSL